MSFSNSNRFLSFCYEIAADINFRSYLFCNDTFTAVNVLQLSQINEINLPTTSEPQYISPYRYTNGLPVVEIWVEHEIAYIASGKGMRFMVAGNVIHWWKSAEISEQIFIQRFLSTVMAYILERDGFPVLHCSAININDKAVGFLANSGGGKTTLATEFISAGFPMVTDDMLALDFTTSSPLALPGYPVMKLDEKVAKNYLQEDISLPYIAPPSRKLKVRLGEDFGSFQLEKIPLKSLYLPVCHDDANHLDITIHTLTPAEALLRLISQSFAAIMVKSLGWDQRRIPLFAQLLQTIPVKEISFPSGLQYLPAIREAVLDDLSNN